jgi:kynurenine formamidase
MRYIDLTHKFDFHMPAYPGDPIPEITQITDIDKDGFTDHFAKMGMHIGTHMDAPMHMVKNTKTLSEIGVEQFFGKGCLIDVRGCTSIEKSMFTDAKLDSDTIVFVMTGFYKKFRTPDYYEKYPEFTPEAANFLVEKKIKIIGMDTPSPDRPPFKVHKILLGNNVLIIENLTNLETLIGVNNFEVIALPAKFDWDGAPARVVARIS